MIKTNAWTLALVSAGLVSLPAVLHAEEASTAQALQTALTSTTISGYVDTSAQWNIGTGSAPGQTPNYAFSNGKADGFNLNVVKLMLEKPIEPTDSWGAGYKVDLWAGPDANLLGSASSLSSGSSDFAVKQAYVSLRAPVGNGLDFKMGTFDTIVGYEVSDGPSNPNHTRSYGYTLEPVLHTGVLASYQVSSALSVSGGVANTFDPTINSRAFPIKAESYKSYLGSVTLTAPEDWGFLAGSTLSGAICNGFNTVGGAVQTHYYMGTSINTPIEKLKVGVAYDYVNIDEQELSTGTVEATWANAIGSYVSYGLTEKLTLYGRGEYTTSDNPIFLARKVVAATATLQYDLWANVLSRLEFRWDHAADGSAPYGDDDDKDSFILLANVAYKF